MTDGGDSSTLQLRFLLDENTSKELGRELTAAGHDVVRSVEHDGLGEGAADDMIRAVAAREDRIVVTYDSDHAIAVRSDGHPPRVFRLKDEHHPSHIQARLVTNALAFVDDVADLPPVYVIGDEFL